MELAFIAIGIIAFAVSILAIHLKGKLSIRRSSDVDDVVASEKMANRNNRGSNSSAILNDEREQNDQIKPSGKDTGGGWKCACEGGGIGLFLPQSMMNSIGGPGAALRLGVGGCYHKQM